MVGNMKKKILIVDDEINVLNGLKRMLRPMFDEWEIEFVDNGQKALELLDSEPFDILVTDMQMPQMSGIELLEKVQKTHPETIRIILSGYTQFETAVKAMGLAHQFLTKPCEADKLKETVSRALLLRNILTQDSLMKLITEMKSLPSLPDVYLKLQELLKCPDIRIDRISNLIASDVGMTAKILQLVNSSFFGVANRIREPGHAVRMLGLDSIKTLVLSVHIFSMFDKDTLKGFPMGRLKEHNTNVATLAKRIAEIAIPEKKAAEEAFIEGLLHDCGKIILIERLPEKYKQVLDLVETRKITLCDAEKDIFGTTHADVGAYLLGLWGMSDSMLETVIFHHSPGKSSSKFLDTLTCVHVADYFSYELDSENDLDTRMPLDMEYLERLNVVNRLDSWHEACMEAAAKGVKT